MHGLKDISIEEVTNRRQLDAFIRFPHTLYQDDACYVPQPNMMVRQMLNPRKNPFFRQGEAACFVARNAQGNIVGRIAAIRNQVHENLYHDATGFFGLFDCINDPAVAGALLEQAASWLRQRGLKHMTGPENLTTNDSVGILTYGFDDPPVFMMPYNYPYYEALLQQNGLQPALTLYSYQTVYAALPADILNKASLLEERLGKKGISFRPVNFTHFENEMENLRQAYNLSNEDNRHFMPLDAASFLHMARDIRQLIKPRYLPLAIHEETIVGYALTLPDYNQVFRHFTKGRLFPFGWYYMLRSRTYIKRCRVMILGTLPAYRGLGIDWCLYARTAAFVREQGLPGGEACYVMEDNLAMNRMMQRLNGRMVKEYRLYSKTIA